MVRYLEIQEASDGHRFYTLRNYQFFKDETERSRWQPVFNDIDLSQIQEWASTKFTVEEHGTPITPGIDFMRISEARLTLSQATFTISFQSGRNWMLKIPRRGKISQYDEKDKAILWNEVYTLQALLHDEPDLPIPKVLKYYNDMNDDGTNDLGVAFILMSVPKGVTLDQIWFDDEFEYPTMRDRRYRALKSLAEAMARLGRFTFDSSGWVYSGYIHKQSLNSTTMTELIFDHVSVNQEDMNENLPHPALFDNTYVCEYFPQETLKSFCTRILERPWGPQKNKPVWPRSPMERLLRLLLDWAINVVQSQLTQLEEEIFTLTNPDLNLESILVDVDGTVKCITDWHGVCVRPQVIGNEAVPKWLAKNWYPDYEELDVEKYQLDRKKQPMFNSPQDLRMYRDTYNVHMQDALQYLKYDKDRISKEKLAAKTRRGAGTEPTQKSALMQTLVHVIFHPKDRERFLRHLFRKMDAEELNCRNPCTYCSGDEWYNDILNELKSPDKFANETDRYNRKKNYLEHAFKNMVRRAD